MSKIIQYILNVPDEAVFCFTVSRTRQLVAAYAYASG